MPRRAPSLVVILSVLALAASALQAGFDHWSDRAKVDVPRVVVLDVGQGDAILLDGPGDGAEVLIDGGPDATILEKLRAHLGPDRTLNLVVLTHPHADHVTGLAEVLGRYEVERVLLTGALHTTREYASFLDTVRSRGIATTIAVAPQEYDVGHFTIDVLTPFEELRGRRVENLNSSSIVLRATIGNVKLLLTGDAEADVEAALLTHGIDLRADVLKVPHHGSQDASSQAFLDAVQPREAIISVGDRNQFRHPHRRTLRRLERIGARIWRTDHQGDITVRIAEDGFFVTPER